MTIQCRTGCGAFVSYEMESFPDGFIYHMPLNLDKTIHNCPNLPENEVNDERYENNTYWKEYRDLAIEIDVRSHTDWERESNKTKIIENSKQHLLLQQIKCTLFPSPLMHGYVDDVDLPDGEKEVWWTNLTVLSDCYENLGMLECAITARLIQEKITNDQTVKILELVKKQKKPTGTTDEEILELNLSVQELRNNYFRKVENMIKSFIRKKYTKKDYLKKDFPILYQKANKLRGNTSKHVEHTNEDVVEFLSFGQCVNILKTNLKDREKEEWHIIDWDIINHAFYVVDRRNDIDHYSGGNLEESIPKESKTLGYVFSKEIIEFFENLNHV